MSLPAIKTFGEREVCQANAAGRREYKRRTDVMAERQDGLCALCGLWMAEESTTFGHECSRGGGKRDDRIMVDGAWRNCAMHFVCNGIQGSRRYAWVDVVYVPA